MVVADDIQIYFTINDINSCLKLQLDQFSTLRLDNGLS